MVDKQSKYSHDCPDCRFLGQTIGGGRIADLYVHDNPDGTQTLIARFSSEGPDYLSALNYQIKPNGHAELYCAKALLERENE